MAEHNKKKMNEFIKQNEKTKLKGLAYYQIAGGVIGIGLTIWLTAQIAIFTGLLLLILILAIGLFLFSIFCGQQLLKGNIVKGLKLSSFNQILQTMNFAIAGFAYKFIAGIMLTVGINYTSNFNFEFNFSLPTFQFNINQDNELLTFGFNIIALGLVFFIDNLKKKIETDKQLFEISRIVTITN